MASSEMNEEEKILQQLSDSLRPMSLKKMVANPLVSCVKAQYKSIEVAYNVLLNHSFNRYPQTGEGKGETIEPIYVSFSYIHNGRLYSLQVPLFTLIPYSFLEIRNVDLSFVADIHCDSEGETKGYIGSKSMKKNSHYAGKGNCSIEYKINMGQSDMTAGLASILQFCSENVVQKTKFKETKKEKPHK